MAGVLVAAQFGGSSCGLRGNESVAELAAEIARWVQDDVIAQLREAWPACPQHEHPLFPEVAAGVAVWICPIDPRSTVHWTVGLDRRGGQLARRVFVFADHQATVLWLLTLLSRTCGTVRFVTELSARVNGAGQLLEKLTSALVLHRHL